MCPLSPAPPLRILDPQEAEELARNRSTWAELWQAVAREMNSADCPETDDEAA